MKTKVYLNILLRIVVLFAIGFFGTFIPEQLRDFFGDTRLPAGQYCGATDTSWVWGKRHYWYHAMGIVLFIFSLVHFIASAVNIIKKNYNTKNW